MSQNLQSNKTNTNSVGIKVFLSLIVMSISVLTGCATGYIYYRYSVEPTPEWRNLGSPPEPIAELVDAEFFTIYVRGESGQLYSYYWESPYAFDGWNEVDTVPEYESFCDESRFLPPTIPSPSYGKVRESVYVRDCVNWTGRDYNELVVYYLIENGDVAQWWSDENKTSLLHMGYFDKLFLNSFVSTVIGFALGIFICVAIWRTT